MSTDPSAPGPGAPTPSGLDVLFARLRGLGVSRARDGRWAGGVCVGLGRRIGVAPIVVRIGFVVLLTLGGVGLLAYLLALALLPDEKGTILAERAIRTGDGSGVVLLVVIGILLAGELSDRWWVWIGIPLALGTWWLVKGAASGKTPAQLRDEARGIGTGLAGTVRRYAAPSAPSGASAPGSPSESVPAGPPPGATAVPSPSRTPQDAPLVLPVGQAPLAGQGAPHGLGPGRTWAPTAPPQPVVREPRRPAGGMPVFVTALGLAAAAYGVAMYSEAARGLTERPAAFALACAGAAAALVLLVAGFRGLRCGVTATLTALVVATAAVAAFVPSGVLPTGGVGERQWTPAVGQGDPRYSLTLGEATLDLSHMSTEATEQPVSATVGIGELVVRVPTGLAVRVEASVGTGEVTTTDVGAAGKRTLASGPGGSETVTLGQGTPDVVVTVAVGLGAVSIVATSDRPSPPASPPASPAVGPTPTPTITAPAVTSGATP